MLKILVDHREDKSVIRELVKRKLPVEIKQLKTADYIILENDMPLVGIERKTTYDFLNSIIDKRIINQIKILKENFELPLIILEGQDNLYSIRNFHPNSIRGMLSSIALDHKMPLIQTKNPSDTAAFISVIANRIEKPKKFYPLLKKLKPLTLKEQQELIIESLPGIGPNLAKSLLKYFKNVENIINADKESLKKVQKIGDKKAEAIIKVLKEKYKD